MPLLYFINILNGKHRKKSAKFTKINKNFIENFTTLNNTYNKIFENHLWGFKNCNHIFFLRNIETSKK